MGVKRAAVLLLLLAGSTIAVSTLAVIACMHLMRGNADGVNVVPVDAIVVLGGRHDLPREHYRPTALRAERGADLYNNGAAPVVVMSGHGASRRYRSLAWYMGDAAIARGVDPEAVLLEEAALTTFDNFHHTFPLMAENGLRSYALVTEDYHLARSWVIANVLGHPPTWMAAARGLEDAPLDVWTSTILREGLAWPHNVLKVLAWWSLGALGFADAERAELVY